MAIGAETATSERAASAVENIENAANKLDGISDRMSESRRLVEEMLERFHGPTPQDIDGASKSLQPSAPSGQLRYLHDRVNAVGLLSDQLAGTIKRLNDLL